jgi:mannose-1-phosphate guanylyltransferase
MNTNTFVAIMAGGVGSRFWPASREARPKQFLDILGTGKSLLRLTFERFLPLCPAERIYIVTHQDYKAQVLEHLPELSPEQVITEPARRNTAPCVAYTALKLSRLHPDANLVVAPSDHIVLKEEAFVETLREGLDFTARHNALLTLGIRPVRPDTGYGYIHYERQPLAGQVCKVLRFTEKPPVEQARAFLESGDYLWNAGIFVWKVKALLEAFQQLAPDVYEPLAAGMEVYNTPAEEEFIKKAYPALPGISIDYAIMEKAGNVFTLPSDFGWSDLGTWASLHAESGKDENGNVVQCAHALLYETENCVVRAPADKLIVVRGLKDFIIVDEGDILMVYPKSKEQEIKTVTKHAKEHAGDQYL